MEHKTTIGLIQKSCCADKEANLDSVIFAIRSASAKGANLVLLPELHNSLYFCQTENTQNFDLAEPVPGESTEQLGALAKELGIVIVASLFERRASGLYHNTAVVLDVDGTIAGIYRKMHIPDDPGYYEKFYFTPGDIGFKPVATSLGKLGVLVCWDQWFPEAARLMTLAGADVLLYPTAIGWDPADDTEEQRRQLNAWKLIQRSHAVANGIPVMVANRTGFEPDPANPERGITFWGNSFIAGPQGEMLTEASQDENTVLTAEIDHQHIENVRRTWPYLRDRRIDAYQDLLKRFCDER